MFTKEKPMRRWIKRTLFGAIGASVLFGGLAACSHHGDRHAWASGGDAEKAARFQTRAVDWVSRELKLDDAQKASLASLAEQFRQQREQLRGPGTDPRAQLTALFAGERFDRAQAKALIDSKTQAIASASPALIDAIGSFYDGLRPEQQARVRELMNRRGHHGWRG
jgi:periplasmic protein CpxP/Spy